MKPITPILRTFKSNEHPDIRLKSGDQFKLSNTQDKFELIPDNFYGKSLIDLQTKYNSIIELQSWNTTYWEQFSTYLGDITNKIFDKFPDIVIGGGIYGKVTCKDNTFPQYSNTKISRVDVIVRFKGEPLGINNFLFINIDTELDDINLMFSQYETNLFYSISTLAKSRGYIN